MCDNCGALFLFQAGIGQLYSIQCSGVPSLNLADVASIQCRNVPASTGDDDISNCLLPLVALSVARDQALAGIGGQPPGSLPIKGVSYTFLLSILIL